MARHKRIQTPGLLRHVMSRGNGRMRIFLDDADYRKFLFILGDVVDTFDIECWDFCVMPNHYHLALYPRKPNISRAIQHSQWCLRHLVEHDALHDWSHVPRSLQSSDRPARRLSPSALSIHRAQSGSRQTGGRSRRLAMEQLCHDSWPGGESGLSLQRPDPESIWRPTTSPSFESCISSHVLAPQWEGDVDDRLRSRERILGDRAFKRQILGREGAESASRRLVLPDSCLVSRL